MTPPNFTYWNSVDPSSFLDHDWQNPKRYADDDLALPLPKPTVVSAERHVVALAPPWAWTLISAVLLGVHWFTRRRSGLS